MPPPEVILDRFVRNRLRYQPGCKGYLGKLDISTVQPRALAQFLHDIQEMLIEELRAEGVNASGGVSHPPFHFDYLAVEGKTRNAHAFQQEDFAFIVITFPLVETMGDLSLALGKSSAVHELLGITSPKIGELQSLFFDIQLHYLVSHEYTHHVHRHGADSQSAIAGLWTEFTSGSSDGGMIRQAEELDADGFATHLVLAHLVQGNGARTALTQLGHTPEEIGTRAADELLLKYFFLATFAFFCEFWRQNFDMKSIRLLTHPPPPVRIDYTTRMAQMWCEQNNSVPPTWLSPERLKSLFGAVADTIDRNGRTTWDAQIAALNSKEGTQYQQDLFETFERVRKKRV